MKKLLLIPILLFLMVACEDRYRYPCQDPSNFNTTACKPPVCKADGTCTKYLISK